MTIARIANARPRAISLTNLDTLDTIEAPSIPTEISYSVSPALQAVKPFGATHGPQQYTGTNNLVVNGLRFDLVAETPRGVPVLTDFEAFALSLTYPADNAISTPDVLLVWPRLISITGKISNVAVQHTHFFSTGERKISSVEITLVQVSDVRITSEVVRRLGASHGSVLDLPLI